MASAFTDRSSVRRQRLQSDVDLIIRACTADKYNPFCRKHRHSLLVTSWLGGSVVERRSLIGELSLVCTGPAADG